MSLRAAARPLFRKMLTQAPIAHRQAAVAFRPVVASRLFSVSAHRLGSGESDLQLTSALQSELEYEEQPEEGLTEAQAKTARVRPPFLDAFEKEGVWKISSPVGSNDVVLTRKFGNETIKVTYQISDLEVEDQSDEALVDSENPEEDEELNTATSLNCEVIITKSGEPGALAIDISATEEGFQVFNVAVFEKTVAEKQGAEATYVRRSRYLGPDWALLDENVQDAMNAYVEERGFDDALSAFVLQYAEWKEQSEYVAWLNNFKSFVQK